MQRHDRTIAAAAYLRERLAALIGILLVPAAGPDASYQAAGASSRARLRVPLRRAQPEGAVEYLEAPVSTAPRQRMGHIDKGADFDINKPVLGRARSAS